LALHALQDPKEVAGHVTVAMVQLCVSVEVTVWHTPPEQGWLVTERDWVPVPPQALALHALQLP
jgi:hypothetical protein